LSPGHGAGCACAALAQPRAGSKTIMARIARPNLMTFSSLVSHVVLPIIASKA
jgi:hypothetical protein